MPDRLTLGVGVGDRLLPVDDDGVTLGCDD